MNQNPSISGNGRIVAFESGASNLVGDDTDTYIDIFVHDRKTGETVRISVPPDGSNSNLDSWFPSISANGHIVAFSSWADNLVAGDSNNTADIFVINLLTGVLRSISVDPEGNQGDDESNLPSISGNGKLWLSLLTPATWWLAIPTWLSISFCP